MAVTNVGLAVSLRLPRWDHHLVERLDTAGIAVPDAPADHFIGHPLEVTMAVPAESEAEARALVTAALRGWTVLLPVDFATAG